MSQSIIASGRPVRNVNENFGDPVVSLSLEAFEAEIEELGYMPEDGLQEGRDYEYVTAEDEDLLVYANIPHIYMFPETGSTDTEAGWKASCDGELDLADFVEVCSLTPPPLLGDRLSDCDPDGWMDIRRIADVMDPEIRERVHDESAWLHKEGLGYMSDQAFLIRYSHLHYDKFGTEFAPIEG